MRKIITVGIMTLLFASCSPGTKDTERGDVLTELRKLNLVDEKSLTPSEKEDHDNNKSSLNKELTDFLEQPENATDFPTLENAKKEIAGAIADLNGQDETGLSEDELANLRNQRTKNVDDLQNLLEKGKLLQDVKNLNNVNEADLSPEDKEKHSNLKNDLSNQLDDLFGREENQSDNPAVQNRINELLGDLKNINSQDESTLGPEELENLRKQRDNDVLELLGLSDGSIVPEEEMPEPEPEPSPPVVPTPQPVPVAPAPQQPVAQPQPRGELFDELLKLNRVDESSLDPASKLTHNDLKQDLNQELKDTLAKDENKLVNPEEEQEKNDLADELVTLDNKDEATLAPDELTELRNKRTEIVERLKDLLANGQRHEAVKYGIVTQEPEGIAVTQKAEKAIDVIFSDMLFAFNKTDLRPPVRETLDRIAEYLKENPDLRVDIGGHSDNIGPEWAKTKVANGRAENAKRYLIQQGVEASRLEAKGYSDKQPMVRPFTRENRRKNRRVEVHITGTASEDQDIQDLGSVNS